MAKELQREYMMSQVSYIPETGQFIRLVFKSPRTLERADRRMARDYRVVSFGAKKVLAHRLAWLFVYGTWPEEEIDHIDGDPSNNRIDNLRLASRRQNCHNVVHAFGSTGFYGVSKQPHTKRFRSRISVNNKTVHIGYFDTPQEASAASVAAAFFARGEFAASQSRVDHD